MRDTLGAIHNLQHLLGSVRVGPKALAHVIPDVRASCKPMAIAARELVAGAEGRGIGAASARSLAELITRRMDELDAAFGATKRGSLRAGDRLRLETSIAAGVRDLDGSLELVELMVEASAPGRVPVDAVDLLRESALRTDTGSGRGRRVRVTHDSAPPMISVRVNPRLAVRLLAFAAALAVGRGAGLHVKMAQEAHGCRIGMAVPAGAGEGLLVAIPPLIDLSERCAAEVALSAGIMLETIHEAHAAVVLFPFGPTD